MKKIKALAIISLVCFSSIVSHYSSAEEHLVEVISDYEKLRMYFNPQKLYIKSGDTVTWVNNQKDRHNMATYPDGYPDGSKGFESDYLKEKGDKFTYKFEKPGTYQYHCYPHVLMGMRGEVIVDRESGSKEMHVPTSEEVDKYKEKMLKIFDPEEYNYAPKYIKEKLDKGKAAK